MDDSTKSHRYAASKKGDDQPYESPFEDMVTSSQSMTRRIAINALSQTMGGGITVARNLTASLVRARPEWTFGLFATSQDQVPAERMQNLEVITLPDLIRPIRRLHFEMLHLPSLLHAGRFELHLALGGFLRLGVRIPQVSVWQNAAIWTRAPIGYSRRMQTYIALQRLCMRASVRLADRSVFLTNESLRECSDRITINPHRVHVVPLGVASGKTTTPRSRSVEPFVLSVGDLRPHKNYLALLEALRILRRLHGVTPTVRVVGRPADATYAGRIERTIRDYGLSQHVEIINRIRQAELVQLYRSATVFVTVSMLESFGLTPLEAMQEGLPVVASRKSCIPEVCGDAALYCNPDDPEDVARSLRRALLDEPLRRQLSERGRRRAAHFSWERTGTAYANLIDNVLAQR